jgi:VacB/RNase II family 3'-5' exoribonuclease
MVTNTHDSPRVRLRSIARRAMIERGLEPGFTDAALAESRALIDGVQISPGTEDLSALLWCSIDNDDSRDLDQLSVAEPAGAGRTRLRVAIADVDSRVPRGSAIDDHARANTTSVYTPAQIFPMLPERLSTDLTSLVPDEPRLAVVVEMWVDDAGVVVESAVGRAIVRNHAKLAYNSVAAWLDGGPAPPALARVPGLEACLRLQDVVAVALRDRRQEQGALSLESSEAHVVFDGEALSDLRSDEKNRAKALIEDFMIAANTVTARFLTAKGFPSIRRVLRAPRRWDRIVALAHDAGARLPAEPDVRALDAFLRERRTADPDRFPDLSLSVIKLLGAGEYSVVGADQVPDGHFGLAVRDYTHSTAPNRRFPDLITQRLVKAALAEEGPAYSRGELDQLATHCTSQEDAADKVERQVRKSAAALLLSDRIGQTFDGIVTGASPKGTWVRVWHPPAEGRVIKGESGMDVGERVRVRLVETDIERGFIDFVAVR